MSTHPEDWCEICGKPNVIWFTDSEVWNKVVRDRNLPEILCPVCFIKLAENYGIKNTGWKLVPENSQV